MAIANEVIATGQAMSSYITEASMTINHRSEDGCSRDRGVKRKLARYAEVWRKRSYRSLTAIAKGWPG